MLKASARRCVDVLSGRSPADQLAITGHPGRPAE